ncbi:uncharacterized protein METZ01_LOCUS122830, partial [marine metagenome]
HLLILPPIIGLLIKKGLWAKTHKPLFKWSQRTELNCRPTDYESVALPLSYAGFTYFFFDRG